MWLKILCFFGRHKSNNSIYSGINPFTNKFDNYSHYFKHCESCGVIYNYTIVLKYK